MPQDEGVGSIKVGHISMRKGRQGARRKARRSLSNRVYASDPIVRCCHSVCPTTSNFLVFLSRNKNS